MVTENIDFNRITPEFPPLNAWGGRILASIFHMNQWAEFGFPLFSFLTLTEP